MLQAQILHKDCVRISNKKPISQIELINKEINHQYNKACTYDVIDSLSNVFKTKFKFKASYPSHHIYGIDKKILNSKIISSLIRLNRLKIIGAPLGKNLTITHHTIDEMKRIENSKI